MFYKPALAILCLTTLVSSFAFTSSSEAQFDLKAQDITLTNHGDWETANFYVRNVSNQFYLGGNAKIWAFVHYPDKNDSQPLLVSEINQWVWAHPQPWNFGHDFWDYRKGISFKPRYRNTTARLVLIIPVDTNKAPFGFDTNYGNQILWRDYYIK